MRTTPAPVRNAVRNVPLAASVGLRQLRDDPVKALLGGARLLPARLRRAAARAALADSGPGSRDIRSLPLLRAVALLAGGRRADALGGLARAGSDPALPARSRRRLAALALAVEDAPAARALVGGLPAGDPATTRLRAGLAAVDGALLDAVTLAAGPAPAGLSGHHQRRAGRRLAGELAVLRPQERRGHPSTTARTSAPAPGPRPGAVLHLVTASLPHRATGYAVRTHEIVRHQRRLGLDAVVATQLGFPVLQGVLAAAPVDVVDGVAYHRLLPRWGLPATRDAALDRAVDLAAELVDAHRPAVLHAASHHVNGQLALRLRERTGLPVVYEARGFLEETWVARAGADRAGAQRHRLARDAETWVMRAADHVVTLGAGMRADIVARGVPAERVSVVPNGVDERFLLPPPDAAPVRAAVGAGPGDVLVGLVSTLNAYEGVDVLVDAVRLLVDRGAPVRLLVVGDGDALGALRAQVAALGLDDRATFTGRVPFSDVRAYHAALDVFVVPRRDVRVARLVTPLKPLEAMAAGRPVVASDLPALAEIVRDGVTGRLAAPGDAAALAGTIEPLVYDAAVRSRLGRDGARLGLGAPRLALGGPPVPRRLRLAGCDVSSPPGAAEPLERPPRAHQTRAHQQAAPDPRGDSVPDLVVIGLGYVGLPLAQEAVRAGLQVVGLDLDPRVVDGLTGGRSHVDDLADGDVQDMLAKGFTATSDPAVLADATTAVICVPTPLSKDGGPDLGAVLGATATIAAHVHPGMLVVLESTTYPGTTDEEVRPLLEAGGLVAGQDFHLAFSPERIDPGNPVFGMRNTPKVVGGHTPACTERAATFYGQFVDTVVRTRGTREAETAKLLENTYRHVNIALVNEMAKFCHELDIDLWDVIRAASSKPFGFQAFYPGPGVGGHCIPIDPNYLSYNVRAKLGYPFRFVELAQEINASMPTYVVRRLMELLNEQAKALRGSTVLLLGVTYKRDIADQRESPARPLAQALAAHGARVQFHDPHVQQWSLGSTTLQRVPQLDPAVADADVTVLLQDHGAYDLAHLAEVAGLLFDTRGTGGRRRAGPTAVGRLGPWPSSSCPARTGSASWRSASGCARSAAVRRCGSTSPGSGSGAGSRSRSPCPGCAPATARTGWESAGRCSSRCCSPASTSSSSASSSAPAAASPTTRPTWSSASSPSSTWLAPCGRGPRPCRATPGSSGRCSSPARCCPSSRPCRRSSCWCPRSSSCSPSSSPPERVRRGRGFSCR